MEVVWGSGYSAPAHFAACFPLLCGDGQSVQQLLDELVTAFHLLLEAGVRVKGVGQFPGSKVSPKKLLQLNGVLKPFPSPTRHNLTTCLFIGQLWKKKKAGEKTS